METHDVHVLTTHHLGPHVVANISFSLWAGAAKQLERELHAEVAVFREHKTNTARLTQELDPIGSQFLTSHAMRPPSWEGRPTPKRANVVTHCLPLTLPAGHCCTRAVRTEQDGHVSVSTQVRNGGRERLRHRSEPIWFKHILFKRNIKTIQ